MEIVIKHLERILTNRKYVLAAVKGRVKDETCLTMQIEILQFERAISILNGETVSEAEARSERN